MHQTEHAIYIDANQLIPGIRVAINDVSREIDACICQHDVEPSKLAESARSTMERISRELAMSAGATKISVSISFASASSRSWERAVKTSLTPFRASSRATARRFPSLRQ